MRRHRLRVSPPAGAGGPHRLWLESCNRRDVVTRTPLLFVAAAALTAVIGCGSSASTSTSVTSPASARCEASVSSPTTSLSSSGGSGTLTVAVARECSWRASTAVSWITFTSSVEGQGDGSVSYRVAENPEPVARQASISVADRQVPLAQDAAPCRYSVGGLPTAVADAGGEQTIEIDTHPVCSWTARAEQAWVAVSPTNGQGDGQIRVSVAPNTGPAREAEVIVAGERVAVRQNAFAAPPAPAPPPSPAPPPPSPPAPPPAPPPTPPPAPPPTPPPAPPPTPSPPSPPAPTPVRQIELDGDVEKLAGACPAWTFELEGRRVYTTEGTTYERGPCKAMRNGKEIELRGMLMSDGTVRADRIRFDD